MKSYDDIQGGESRVDEKANSVSIWPVSSANSIAISLASDNMPFSEIFWSQNLDDKSKNSKMKKPQSIKNYFTI